MSYETLGSAHGPGLQAQTAPLTEKNGESVSLWWSPDVFVVPEEGALHSSLLLMLLSHCPHRAELGLSGTAMAVYR